MTRPDEPQTPRTDAQFSECIGMGGKWDRLADLSRQLELELIGSRRIIDEMGVELRKAQERCAELELAEVDRNSVRYLWLRNNVYVEGYYIDGAGGVDTAIRVQGHGEHLDAAIDAAIKP